MKLCQNYVKENRNCLDVSYFLRTVCAMVKQVNFLRTYHNKYFRYILYIYYEGVDFSQSFLRVLNKTVNKISRSLRTLQYFLRGKGRRRPESWSHKSTSSVS